MSARSDWLVSLTYLRTSWRLLLAALASAWLIDRVMTALTAEEWDRML
jgi:hypothetical protein